MIPRFNAVY